MIAHSLAHAFWVITKVYWVQIPYRKGIIIRIYASNHIIDFMKLKMCLHYMSKIQEVTQSDNKNIGFRGKKVTNV
jgi:hypothetical protein